jgi:hypothetical protein
MVVLFWSLKHSDLEFVSHFVFRPATISAESISNLFERLESKKLIK